MSLTLYAHFKHFYEHFYESFKQISRGTGHRLFTRMLFFRLRQMKQLVQGSSNLVLGSSCCSLFWRHSVKASNKDMAVFHAMNQLSHLSMYSASLYLFPRASGYPWIHRRSTSRRGVEPVNVEEIIRSPGVSMFFQPSFASPMTRCYQYQSVCETPSNYSKKFLSY